jgi:hypothetical protein
MRDLDQYQLDRHAAVIQRQAQPSGLPELHKKAPGVAGR